MLLDPQILQIIAGVYAALFVSLFNGCRLSTSLCVCVSLFMLRTIKTPNYEERQEVLQYIVLFYVNVELRFRNSLKALSSFIAPNLASQAASAPLHIFILTSK